MKNVNEALFRKTAPDRLELKKGGGCIGLFGTPFFLAGLFILLISMQIIPVSNANDIPWYGWIFMSFMGLIFTGVGAGLMFGRSWISINKTKHRIWKAWGLLRPMKGEQYDLGNYNGAVLSFIRGDSDTADSYAVTLKSGKGKSKLDMCTSLNYGKALEQAMLLADFLNFNLEDKTTDHHVKIKHEDIETGKTPVSKDEIPDISPQPAYMKCEVGESTDELQISIPGPAFSAFNLVGVIFPLIILLVFVLPLSTFFNKTNTPAFVQYFFLGFIGLFFVLLPLIQTFKAYRLSRRFTTFVKVNSQGISIEENLPNRKKSILIPVEEIIGIDYGTSDSTVSLAMDNSVSEGNWDVKAGGVSAPYAPFPRWMVWLRKLARSKGVFIKSKKDIYSFGAGLPDEEVYHLYTLVLHYLNKL